METENLLDVINLISDIRHGKIRTSADFVTYTVELLQKLIGKGEWENAQELMELIKVRIKRIKDNLPQVVIVPNIMRHMLKVIRDEHDKELKVKTNVRVMFNLSHAPKPDYTKKMTDLKINLLDYLAEYKTELESSSDNIAAQAVEHIHPNEIILTAGKSSTVEKFLKTAAKSRKFQVIVVEGSTVYRGHEMAASLSKTIQTTVIPDTQVYAIMSRMNKVIIGTHTVLANGGLRAASGVHQIALAANHCAVPIIVLSHLVKLTPMHIRSNEQQTFNVCASPGNILPYSFGPAITKIGTYHPIFDYVPPELVKLLITHVGGNCPSYFYRLLSELYHSEDYKV